MMTSLFTASICVISAAMLATGSGPEPRRLAIYYGIPSLVNGAGGDVARAADAFADYDMVVFGDGLEFEDVVASRTPVGPGPIEHGRTKEIIARLAAGFRKTAVFGYIDLGRSQQLSLDEIRARCLRWKTMGASGIFFDEAGADFGVDRARQNAATDTAHAAGLRVVLNAFNPDDVFRTGLDGARPRLTTGDGYLLESFAVRNGIMENPQASRDRLQKAVAGATATGAALWATTTTTRGFEPALMDHAWRSATQAGIEAFGWGEPSFSSADSQLPFRPRPR
jgi:hypothetical protein